MKKREEEMLEQNEKKRMEQLKESLRQEEIPQGVSPLAIKEKLLWAEAQKEDSGGQGKDSAKRTPLYRYKRRKLAAAMWALAVLAVALGAFGVRQAVVIRRDALMAENSPANRRTEGQKNDGDEDLQIQPSAERYRAQQIACAGSYEELFRVFQDLQVTDPTDNLNPLGGSSWETYEINAYDGAESAGAAFGSDAINSGAVSGGTSFGGAAPAESKAENESAPAGSGPQTGVADMEDAGAMAGEESVSTTNVQEEGVDEADVIKTDGTFIYILQQNENALRVVRADGGQMTECDNHLLDAGDDTLEATPVEFYASDGLVTVIMQYRQKFYYDKELVPLSKEEADARLAGDVAAGEVGISNSGDGAVAAIRGPICYSDVREYVAAETFSVGEDGSLTSLGRMTQDGSYRSSRKVNGILYLFTTYYTSVIHADGSVVEEYVPRVNGICIPADSIAMPDMPSNSYIVGSSFACGTPGTVISQFSVLDANFYADVYVSQNAIYFAEAGYAESGTSYHEYTQILKYTYQDGVMTPYGSANVKGQIHNTFSMDEQEGYLRLVTTENVEKTRYIKYGEPNEYGEQEVVETADQWFDGSVQEHTWELENHLFVLDENMRQAGSIEDIAKGEEIKSARFMGDTGYFVTYENTDPLFSVDLSDPSDPKIMGALKIPGFSEYLHFYSDGLLLGLGQETDEESGNFISLKLSMFDISDPYHVQETDKYLLNDVRKAYFADAMTDHKALLIAPSRNIIGFSAASDSVWDEETMTSSYDCCYSIYGYGETGFYEQFAFGQQCSAMRGLFVGDVLYICTWREAEGETLTAFDMANGYEQIGELNLPKNFTRRETAIEDFVYYE